jgi:hypothetical protein
MHQEGVGGVQWCRPRSHTVPPSKFSSSYIRHVWLTALRPSGDQQTTEAVAGHMSQSLHGSGPLRRLWSAGDDLESYLTLHLADVRRTGNAAVFCLPS